MKALINVKYSEWLADGERFEGGEQEVEVSAELAPLLASAVSAGAVELVDPSDKLLELLDPHVESDEVSLEKLAEAMGEWVPPAPREDGTIAPGYWTGPWHEANVAQRELDRAAAEIAVDVDPVEAS